MGTKRKQPDNPSDNDDYDFAVAADVDIASALVDGESGDDVSGDETYIRNILRKKHVKDGAEIMKQAKGKGKSHVKRGEIGGGSFQSMGLHPSLLRALTLRGYRTPTPIQRLTVPALLMSPPRDLVGMARTGSGKTLAYMIPLIQRLGGQHSTAFGARALILIPTRELALQVLKVGKELARGWHSDGGDHAGDVNSSSLSGSLRWGLVVGGEGLDDQFEMLTNNPDVIIATPGRLLHVAVEMNLDLRSVQYVVFDEADRLFELGFSVAMTEILGRLPSSRQTLLFSATLPKSLVEFAKAGLQNPKLIRLDADSKISADLRMAFFSVKQAEKDASLLVLLRDVIRVPLGTESVQEGRKGSMAPHQTIVFVATKHHVEYVCNLLISAGYSVSHIYGALDQVARTVQMDRFRRGITTVLVVTDVAARGIDIPVLENVINYDFPQGSRVFVHRVGRTARAGRKGWAWSFVTNSELPHLLDLQLFLARPLVFVAGSGQQSYVDTLVLGPFRREVIDAEVEFISTLDEKNTTLPNLREVVLKAQRMYEKSQGKASQASYKRAKEMIKDPTWPLAGSTAEHTRVHPIILSTDGVEDTDTIARNAMLDAVNTYRPAETVFEIGTRGKTGGANLMKERRKALAKAIRRAPISQPVTDSLPSTSSLITSEVADESDIEAVFGANKRSRMAKEAFQDSEFYMSHYQKDSATEKGYSLRDGASFVEQAASATFDLMTDEGLKEQKRLRSQLKWDRKKKKFVKGAGEGADNVKIIKTESGTRLPSTYRTGRFDEWKKQHRTSLPRIGETENPNSGIGRGFNFGIKRFKHNQTMQAKPLDKLAKNFERKARHQVAKSAGVNSDSQSPTATGSRKKIPSRFAKGKPAGKARQELRSADQIRRMRMLTEQKRAKNARTPRKGKPKGRR